MGRGTLEWSSFIIDIGWDAVRVGVVLGSSSGGDWAGVEVLRGR
jgi:hypothetical protein